MKTFCELVRTWKVRKPDCTIIIVKVDASIRTDYGLRIYTGSSLLSWPWIEKVKVEASVIDDDE